MSHIAHTVLGREYPGGFLDVAWRWLLQNHPHDSICGCSIDRVPQDMVYRFSQCKQIGERLTVEALTALAAHIEGDPEDDELRIVVFNPLPEPMFHVFDAEGAELPVQKLSLRWNRTRFRTFDIRFPQVYNVHEARVSLPLSLPPLGYATLRVHRGEPAHHARVKLGHSLVTGARTMENGHLAVAIDADGTLAVTDKRTG